MALKTGVVFAGRFRVVEPLGDGGNGEVYEVEDDKLARRCALKVLVGHRQRDAKSRERFERESKAAASIVSDHVVRIYDYGVDEDGTPWLLMERLHGQTLEAHVVAHGPLSVEEARRLVVQLGHALGAAHAKDILHLDLKPANLFLAQVARAEATTRELKVLDFGLAQTIQAGRTNVQQTTQSGTLAWMPPEQHDQGAQLRKTADVWPLGLIAFWMLTGRSYWKGLDAQGNANNLLNFIGELAQGATASATARAKELGAGARLPDGFDAWFVRCMAADASLRWPDGAEATRALQGVLERASSVPPVPVAPPVVRLQETQEGAPAAPPVGLTDSVKVLFPKAEPAPLVEAARRSPSRAVGVPWRRVGAVGGGGALALVGAVALWSKGCPQTRSPGRDAAVVVARDAAPAPPPGPPPRVTEGCVQLAGGTFTMGSLAGERRDDERPQHQVTVAPFCIDRTEVTVGVYRACVTAGQCTAPMAHNTDRSQGTFFCNWGRGGVEGHPINCVTQPQAEAFCVSRGGHLPTEDQWEFAARGTAGRKYPWGSAPEPSPQNGNLCGTECLAAVRGTAWSGLTGIANWTDPWGTTAPVADLPRAGDTPEGLIGMAGNVWEWTRTPYGRYTSRAGNATEYTRVDRNFRVFRGGGWYSHIPSVARAAYRDRVGTTGGDVGVGFRCVAEGR